MCGMDGSMVEGANMNRSMPVIRKPASVIAAVVSRAG
jgi:hypothetical protein